MTEMVQIKIGVCVGVDGDWVAEGGKGRFDIGQCVCTDEPGDVLYWITAEVPLPSLVTAEIQGKAELAAQGKNDQNS